MKVLGLDFVRFRIANLFGLPNRIFTLINSCAQRDPSSAYTMRFFLSSSDFVSCTAAPTLQYRGNSRSLPYADKDSLFIIRPYPIVAAVCDKMYKEAPTADPPLRSALRAC